MRLSIPQAEQSSTFEIAFPGNYMATIIDGEEKAGPKGPYIEWSLDLHGVEKNAEGQPLKGRVGRVTERTTLIEGQRWRLSQMAQALGLDPSNFDTEEFKGRQVMVSIEVDQDPAKKYPARNQIKKFLKS